MEKKEAGFITMCIIKTTYNNPTAYSPSYCTHNSHSFQNKYCRKRYFRSYVSVHITAIPCLPQATPITPPHTTYRSATPITPPRTTYGSFNLSFNFAKLMYSANSWKRILMKILLDELVSSSFKWMQANDVQGRASE